MLIIKYRPDQTYQYKKIFFHVSNDASTQYI